MFRSKFEKLITTRRTKKTGTVILSVFSKISYAIFPEKVKMSTRASDTHAHARYDPKPRSSERIVPTVDAQPGQIYRAMAQNSQNRGDHLRIRPDEVKKLSPVATSCRATS